MKEKEMPFPLGKIDDFRVYLPPEDLDEKTAMLQVRQFNDANRSFAEKFNCSGETPRISASFVYAHPADYRGKPMLHADVSAWRTELQRLKDMHIDSVIFQAALWRELNECFYRSKSYSFMKQYPVAETLLEAAEQEKIRVYLGGYGSVAGWTEHFSEEELKEEIAEHRRCFQELKDFPSVAGFYFPCETSYVDRRLPEKEHRMHILYRNFSDMVKSCNPNLKIIISPATMHRPEHNPEFIEFWNAILEDTQIDILMPQDCIGNCCSHLEEIPAQWQAWKKIADENKMKLWSHTELFERRSFYEPVNLYPASPRRVAAQLALTAPYAERHCCWEALYFASADAGEEGVILEKYLGSGNIT